MSQELATPVDGIAQRNGRGFTAADAVTIAGYGLGLWWCSGGPDWAALASIGLDEIDEPLARALGTEGRASDAINWGADIALTPLALLRLSRDLDTPAVAAVGSPVILALQAKAKAAGFRPRVLSARALVMLAAIALESRKAVETRDNPSRRAKRRDRR